jgi:hypothetical protein
MKWQMKKALYRGIIIVCASFVAACHSVPLHPQLDSQNYRQKIPLKVGILILPTFRNYSYTELDSGEIESFDFPIGQASSTLLTQAFGSLFESTVLLSSREQLRTNSMELAGTIEPVIEEFRLYLPKDWRYIYRARITYRFVLYSATGERLGSWTVSGYASKAAEHVLFFTQARGAAADLAMQEAVANLLAEFRKVPDVYNWLKVSGVRASPD